ncbi:MAG: alpha/beta fold hydrolase [Myxococcales bacterium]
MSMRVVDGIFSRARQLGRIVGDGVADTGKAALYVRQLLRGNNAAPSILTAPRPTASRVSGTSGPTSRVPQAPPVLLLHGYMATRGSVHLMEERLTAFGHVVMTYRFGPVHLRDIRESAAFIAGKVESLVAQTGVKQVDVVAHSMGGLVALDYLKRLEGHRRVRRLVLLGTPSLGTWSALLGIATAPLGRASLQLLPGSSFLRELASRPMPPGPELISISADRDWLAPPHTTVIEGARCLTVPTGHSGLLVDESIAQMVSEILGSPPAGGVLGGPVPAASGRQVRGK